MIVSPNRSLHGIRLTQSLRQHADHVLLYFEEDVLVSQQRFIEAVILEEYPGYGPFCHDIGQNGAAR